MTILPHKHFIPVVGRQGVNRVGGVAAVRGAEYATGPGSRIWVADGSNGIDKVYEARVTDAWTLNGLEFTGNTMTIPDSKLECVEARPDGSEFFTCNTDTYDVTRHALDTAYDITSRTGTTQWSLDQGVPYGIRWGKSGAKLYACDMMYPDAAIEQYTAGTAYDGSTLTSDGYEIVDSFVAAGGPEIGNGYHLIFAIGSYVYQWETDTQWDFFGSGVTVTKQGTWNHGGTPTGLMWNDDGSELLVAANSAQTLQIWTNNGDPYTVVDTDGTAHMTLSQEVDISGTVVDPKSCLWQV